MSIQSKVNAIKNNARENLTSADDYYNNVEPYLREVVEIREQNKLHNDKKSKELLQKLLDDIQDIHDDFKRDDFDVKKYKSKQEALVQAYYRYAKANASLDRLGDATLFYDAVTDMYVRISRYEDVLHDGSKHDRIRTDRFKPTTINKFIDAESKKLIGTHIDTSFRAAILREFKPYVKEFAPLKPSFYGEFFNTYKPNGFLDVKVENSITVEKFVDITMPKRYPIINSLLENIAPFIDERVFLLNWLSTILNTAKKTKTAIILKGIQRTGKGVFASKIIEYAMHESNCFVATNANLSDSFNSYLEDKLFITFDEVKGNFHKDKDIANKIKLIVSEENISIRTMHTNPYMVRFSANCIFLSNEDLPIPMDQSDERLSVIETKSRTLEEVAREKLITKSEFISLLEKERDEFLVHLKMCKFDKQRAMSTIKNKTKKSIQDATSTTQSVLKTAFRSNDFELIDGILEEAIQDTKNDFLIKKEEDVLEEGRHGKTKIKKPIPFNFKNIDMKHNFIDEFKAGIISNTSLKWFSIVTNIEHILKNDSKFGNFWNLILSQATIVKLKWEETNMKDGKATKQTKECQEKFRTIDQHAHIDSFFFNKKEFIFLSDKRKTAKEITL
jgi:hypothetical protein